jgi:hypothetical protein
MRLEDVSLGPDGFESRLFECFKCNHVETRAVPSDPIKSNVVRWLAGELKAPVKSRAIESRIRPQVWLAFL